MPKQPAGSGVKKKPRGRPAGVTGLTLRRATYVRFYRSCGFPDETILGAIAPDQVPAREMSEHERRALIRKTLNRWESAAGPGAATPNAKLRQTASYAVAACGDRWLAVRREHGWETGDVPNPEVLSAVALQLQRQIDATRACVAAGLVLVPSAMTAAGSEAYCELLESKIATIDEMLAASRRTAAKASRDAATGRVARMTTSDWADLSAAERRALEEALGIDLPPERPSASDALSRLTVEFDDRG